MRFEHFAINVPDPVKMAQWYVDNLDMITARSQNQRPFTHFLADSSGQIVLEIYSNPIGEIPNYSEMSPLTFHIAFLVDDMAKTSARLIEAGAAPEGDVEITPAGDQLAFLRDPWSVTVQLVKRNKPLL